LQQGAVLRIIDNARLAADMEAAKQFLANVPADRRDPKKALYVCIAIHLAYQHNKISPANANTLAQEVRHRINDRSTLANFLKENDQLPNSTLIPGGYDLVDPPYLVIRDKFVDDIIKFYKEQT
jgi:uncharacterized protein HemY